MRLVLALLCVSFAGCVSSPVDDVTVPDEPEFTPHVVVAVIDTGNNPYHVEYAEQYDDRDPAEYIPGYPGAEVLRLSEWDGGSRNRADADADVWRDTKPGVLYRYEGTKIIGHISFGGDLPGSGHGTMTASRATGNTISVGGPTVRLVVVQGFTHEAIEWAANQEWIDIISISSGLSLLGLAPAGSTVLEQGNIDVFEAAADKKPFFASSGNGVGNAGVLGFPTWLRGASGAPNVISVGANDNGDMSIWHNWQPYIVGDGCRNPSVRDNSADDIADTGGGTSSATPFSAGAGAALLLEARALLGDSHVGVRESAPVDSWSTWDSRHGTDATLILAEGDGSAFESGPLADGIFTVQEFKDVLYHTALADGTHDDSDGAQCFIDASTAVDDGLVPEQGRSWFQGYGEVNAQSIEAAKGVLRGEPIPQRTTADGAYVSAHMMREAVYLG